VLYAKVKLAIAGIFAKEFDTQKAATAYENIASSSPELARESYLKMGQLYRNNQITPKRLILSKSVRYSFGERADL